MTGLTQAALQPHAGSAKAWFGWTGVWWLTLGVVALRVAYLVAWNPYQLAADEAQYWDWSRNLSLSYYTKGPGVAWLIGASVGLFGAHEWAVRLPAALCAAVTMLVLARIAWEISGDGRAAFMAAALFVLSPAFIATSQFMTIDPPFFTCWALAAWAALRVFTALRDGRSPLAAWAALGLVVGVGVLFKYTMLLIVPGVAAYALVKRRELRWGGRGWAGVGLALVVFAAAISPVILWNAQHDWSTVRHLLGRLRLPGGDMPVAGVSEPWLWWWAPLRVLEMIGTQVGIVSPTIVVLIGVGLWWARRKRDAGVALMIWLAAPILLFYGAVALGTKVLANWPLAGFLTLFVVAARPAGWEWEGYQKKLAAWRAEPGRPWRGWLRRKPETAYQVAWHWSVGVGVAAALGVAWAPLLQNWAPVSGFHRVTGHDRHAAVVAAALEQAGDGAFVIADSYGKTALMAFYLPGRPVTYSAAHRLGDRPSAYDQFAATDLDDPSLMGRPAVLVGSPIERWREALRFDTLEPVDDAMGGVYVLQGYAGWSREGEP